MKQYLNILERILKEGTQKETAQALAPLVSSVHNRATTLMTVFLY